MYLEYIIFFMLKAEVCIKNNSNIHLYNHGKIFKFRMFNIPEITQVLVNFFYKWLKGDEHGLMMSVSGTRQTKGHRKEVCVVIKLRHEPRHTGVM